MRIKVVGYWGRTRMQFECMTDSRRFDGTVDVSMFDLMRAAGFNDLAFTEEQAKSLIGKEFDVPGLMPTGYLCDGKPTLSNVEKWKDLGEESFCENCGDRYCYCGSPKPIAA